MQSRKAVRKKDRKPAKRVTVTAAWTTKPLAPRRPGEEIVWILYVLRCFSTTVLLGDVGEWQFVTRGAECGGKGGEVYERTSCCLGVARPRLPSSALAHELKETYRTE